jgi:hypothetical protein
MGINIVIITTSFTIRFPFVSSSSNFHQDSYDYDEVPILSIPPYTTESASYGKNMMND